MSTLPAVRSLSSRHESLTIDGITLHDVTLSGSCYGCAPGTAPVFVLIGGITADPRPFGDGTEEGWWPALRGETRVDPERHTILAPALPGSGTTWRGLQDTDVPLPPLSVTGIAQLVEQWLVDIGCPDGVRAIGASLGGLVCLALSLHRPERVARLVTVSAGARPDAWGTGVRHLQRELVQDAHTPEALVRAMSLARQIGMLTYRGRAESEGRFGDDRPDALAPSLATYLDHHGQRFAERFSARSFLLLSGAIDRFRLGAQRDDIVSTLSHLTARVVVVGVPQDLLFPFRLQKELHEDLLRAGVDSTLRTLSTDRGHDGFLTDQEDLAQMLGDTGVFEADPEPVAVPVAPPDPLAVRTVRIGLAGCGVVGQALLELLDQRRDHLAERHGLRFEVVRIAVRDLQRDRGPFAHGIPRTTEPLDLARDALVDVVVDAAGGQGTIAELVHAALEVGKPVVTANKVLVSRQLGPLAALSTRTGTPLACEAAAAAALPVLGALGRQLDAVTAIQAIVNGTCNFALTRLEEDLPLDEALRIAQAKGFAEEDPSADIDGHDAAAKLTLLAYRCFGVWAPPDTFTVRGIRELTPVDTDLAGAFGLRIRHVAHARRTAAGLALAVEPIALPSWHLLASVEEEYNAVYVTCASAGDLAFFGKGAGGPPTASALLSDLVDVTVGTSVGWPAPRPLTLLPMDAPREHLVRVTAPHDPATTARIEAMLRRAGLTTQARTTAHYRGRHYLAWTTAAVPTAQAEGAADRLRDLALVEAVQIVPIHH